MKFEIKSVMNYSSLYSSINYVHKTLYQICNKNFLNSVKIENNIRL